MKTVTKVSIVNGLVLLSLTICEFVQWIEFDLLLSYQWHKILHILGVILFMGNMIVGPVWFSVAYFSKDEKLIRFSSRMLEVTDMYLTIPGVILTVVNGLCLASVFGGTSQSPWLFYSIVLLFIMWFLSIPLIYIQERLYKLLESDPLNTKVSGLLASWAILGTIVMIPPSVIFYLMVVKVV